MIITPAEESGWEVWQIQQGDVQKTRDVAGALSKNDTSSGERLALPVEVIATTPIRVASSSEELYRGAAQLELEKAGLLSEADESSWDCSLIIDKGPGSIVAGYALLEDMLGPDNEIQDVQLDSSPRCYPVSSQDLIICWREQGKWVLACYSGGKPFYTELLGSDLVETLAPAVKQLEVQLMLSGVEFEPEKVVVWSIYASAINEENLVQLSAETGLPVVHEAKPMPVMRDESLKIRTSSMIEWSEKQAAGSRARVWFLGVLLMYLIAAGFIFLKWREMNNRIEDQQRIIAANLDSYEGNTLHDKKWRELNNLVRPDWPLAVYQRCKQLLPAGTNGISFDMVELQSGQVVLRGSAPSIDPINKYVQQLKVDPMFEELEWAIRPHRRDAKTNRWQFDFEAVRKEVY